MPPTSRRTQQREELTRDVIEAALIRLRKGGPAAVTLRGIARDVGVTAPALYNYFPSLADLFTKLIVQSYHSLAADVAEAARAGMNHPHAVKLAAGPTAYRSWALAHRQQFNLIFFDQITGFEAPVDGPTVDAQTAALRPIATCYAEAIGKTLGELMASDELLDAFLGWWGAFHGIVALEVNHHLDWRTPGKVFEAHLEASINTLMATTR